MADDITTAPAGGTTTILGGDTAAPTATEAAPTLQPTEATQQPVEAAKTEAATTEAAATETPPATTPEAAEPAWIKDGFPDDWRERTIKMLGLTGDAEKKAMDRAKRAGSPAELLRSVVAGDAKIGELSAELKSAVKIPGENAKPEDIAAFQKAWGVPEAPDKYDLKELGDLSEADKEIWDEVLPKLHKANYSQTQLAEAAQALKTAETIAARRMQEKANAAKAATDDALIIEYGSRKAVEANVELANRWLADVFGKHMDGEARTAFLNMQLADGTSIGAHPGFVRAAIAAARETMPDALPDIGDGGQAIDVNGRIKQITALAHSKKDADVAEYARLQPELHKLIAIQNRRNGSGAAR